MTEVGAECRKELGLDGDDDEEKRSGKSGRKTKRRKEEKRLEALSSEEEERRRGKKKQKKVKNFIFRKKRFRWERLRIEMKTETEANFSRSMPLWKIRISFLAKEGNKNPEFIFFCLYTKRKAEKAGFGSG